MQSTRFHHMDCCVVKVRWHKKKLFSPSLLAPIPSLSPHTPTAPTPSSTALAPQSPPLSVASLSLPLPHVLSFSLRASSFASPLVNALPHLRGHQCHPSPLHSPPPLSLPSDHRWIRAGGARSDWISVVATRPVDVGGGAVLVNTLDGGALRRARQRSDDRAVPDNTLGDDARQRPRPLPGHAPTALGHTLAHP